MYTRPAACRASVCQAQPQQQHPWPKGAQARKPKFGSINQNSTSGGGVCLADTEHKAVENLLHLKWEHSVSLRQHPNTGWGNVTTNLGLMICALAMPHPAHAEATQPSSEIISQLFLFFLFLTERPLSDHSAFMLWISHHPVPIGE